MSHPVNIAKLTEMRIRFGPHYTTSRFTGVVCGCGKEMQVWEYAQGFCYECMRKLEDQGGMTAPRQITPEEQERGWQSRMRECGVPLIFLSAARHDFPHWPDRLWGWPEERLRMLYLYGPPGSGKTHLACAMLRQWIEAERRGLFALCGEAMDRLREAYDVGSAHEIERFYGADLLILDDLGSERETAWTAERLYLIIAKRESEGKPTIVTSNVAPPMLGKTEPRLISRLTSGVSLEIIGGDRRIGGKR